MNNRRARVRDFILGLPYVFDVTTTEIDNLTHCTDRSILHIIEDNGAADAMRMIYAAANWFNLTHVDGTRDPQGEVDFLSIRLVCALHEKKCYDKLTDAVREALRLFFTTQDYRSIHGSENHALMYRASRILAAQFYKGEYFSNADMSAEECYRVDLEYIKEFILFRAKHGWGEFDALGYAGEIYIILTTLHKYTDDAELKNMCKMMLDVIMLDMINDSLSHYYGGAHGRSYPDSIIDRQRSEMSQLYRYYFGTEFETYSLNDSVNIYLSDYVPSDIVYSIVASDTLPRESRERKHLHLMSAWKYDILWDRVSKELGSINKYTYVCNDYVIGAVNHQDDYSAESIPDDRGYAHHQQQEWELTLPASSHKIFSHHYGIANYHKINTRWTGDWGCCCGSFYSDKQTVVAMYNIDNRDLTDIVNAYIPLEVFSKHLMDGKYVFLEYGKLYISVYFDNGYEVCLDAEDEFYNREFISHGWQNAVVLRVRYASEFDSFEDFIIHIKSLPVVFDRKERTVSFDNILLTTTGNFSCGEPNSYPYTTVYDSPYIYSIWGSGIIEIKCGGKNTVYDFNLR